MPADPSLSESVRHRFLEDHRRLADLLGRLLSACEANDREEIQHLWTDLEAGLLVHMEAEEKYLIPALLRSRESDARQLLADHAHIRNQLADLGAGVDLHIVRFETARALVQKLREHAQNEDAIYRWADAELGESERTSLLSAIARTVRAVIHSHSR